mgnify:CR=1 FL=1
MTLLFFRCLPSLQDTILVWENKPNLAGGRNQSTIFINKPDFIFETSVAIRQELPIVDHPGKAYLVKDLHTIDFCKEASARFIVRKKNLDKMFSKYGVEKYDAFDDVGGKLSFALALLDKDNTGLILNAVHSRDNCFLYLKEIVKGESYVMLSQEEVEALRKAVNFGLGDIEEQ